MMTSSRRAKNYVVALTFVLLAGCQNYNFNPVGHCIVQPGSTRIKMDNVGTADILFVIDDSSSMDPMQQGLADSFTRFINQMVATNVSRASRSIEPVDYHIAITTSSIFYAWSFGDPDEPTYPNAKWCVKQGSDSQCCKVNFGGCVAKDCTPGESCDGNKRCVADLTAAGEATKCCDVSECGGAGSGCFLGDQCANFEETGGTTYFSRGGCTMSYAGQGAPYPAGNFVAYPGNPKVIHFGKNLPWSAADAANAPAIKALVEQFKQNIIVGSCGSGQEQGLEAARLAIQKAQAGQQPGVERGEWPHQGAKLVVVWVGNEDDCSNKQDQPLTVAWDIVGSDSCSFDRDLISGSFDGRRLNPLDDYANYFSGLVNSDGAVDFGAAFIVSAATCGESGGYTALQKDDIPASCVAPSAVPAVCEFDAGAGVRFVALEKAFSRQDYKTVQGSVCEKFSAGTVDFGDTLAAIARMAEPPTSVLLDTVPAAGEVTVLKIFKSDGSSKTCVFGTDWWFTSTAGSEDHSTIPTKFIYINHATNNCEASPGDTYSAEYIGMLPPEGCATAADCAAALSNNASDVSKWICSIEAGNTRGTCLCAR